MLDSMEEEQLLGYRHLSHLEDGHPGVTDNLGAYLHQLELYARKRPVRDLLRKRKPAHEVADVVRQHEQRETDPVGHILRTREPRPGEGIFALLDALFTGSPPVVEVDNGLG